MLEMVNYYKLEIKFLLRTMSLENHGVIHSKTGPLAFIVSLTDGRRVRYHLN